MIDLTKTSIYKLAEKASKLDQGKMFQEVMDNSFLKQLIIELNTEHQLMDGVDSNNEDLYSIYNFRGYYSRRTEVITNGRKIAGDHYTLYDTGEFYRSFKVKVYRDGILITADGKKEDTDLFIEYGEEIVGLTPENIKILANEARQFFIRWVRKELSI